MKYEYLKGSDRDFEGAPDWAMVAVKHYTSSSCDFASSPHDGSRVFYPLEKKEVTILDIDDWELIAERKPITDPSWDGVGFPPVGCECEAMIHNPETAGCAWRKVKVVHVGAPGSKTEALVFDVETTYPSWADELRPLRPEADKNRDYFIRYVINHQRGVFACIDNQYGELYDAIAAGKVPGVKLEG